MVSIYRKGVVNLSVFMFKYLVQNIFSFIILPQTSPVHMVNSCARNPITLVTMAYDLALNFCFVLLLLLLCYSFFNKMSFERKFCYG